MWAGVPFPADAAVIVPGLVLARAMNSGIVFAGTDGLTSTADETAHKPLARQENQDLSGINFKAFATASVKPPQDAGALRSIQLGVEVVMASVQTYMQID